MFYETERVIRKQKKYFNRKAKEVVNSFKDKLSPDEVIACLDILFRAAQTETEAEILNIARNIISKENGDDQDTTAQLSFISKLF